MQRVRGFLSQFLNCESWRTRLVFLSKFLKILLVCLLWYIYPCDFILPFITSMCVSLCMEGAVRFSSYKQETPSFLMEFFFRPIYITLLGFILCVYLQYTFYWPSFSNHTFSEFSLIPLLFGAVLSIVFLFVFYRNTTEILRKTGECCPPVHTLLTT